MEVINPIIIAGKSEPGGSLLGNTFCQVCPMMDSATQNTPIMKYLTVVPVNAPLMYLLRPGDYTLPAGGIDAALLEEYGIPKDNVKRLYMAGNIQYPDTTYYLNFYGYFDKENYSPNYVASKLFADQTVLDRSAVLSAGAQGMAAIAINAIYSGYAELGLITLADISKPWRDYSVVNISHILVEQYS